MPIPTTSFQSIMDWRDVVNSSTPPQKKCGGKAAVTDCVYEDRGESKPLIGAKKKRIRYFLPFCPSPFPSFSSSTPIVTMHRVIRVAVDGGGYALCIRAASFDLRKQQNFA